MGIDKGLGFIRNINLSWLDAAAEARLRNEDIKSMREELDQYLKGEISGHESRRKTIDVLISIWHRNKETDTELFNQALELFPKLNNGERVWLHYGLTLMYYPFFRQTASVIGQFARTGESFTRASVKDRLASELGHLGSLNRAAERVVASLLNWGALAHQKKGNTYIPQLRVFKTDNLNLQVWLLACALFSHQSTQLPFTDLVRLPELFPIHILVDLDILKRDGRFRVLRQGIWDMVGAASKY